MGNQKIKENEANVLSWQVMDRQDGRLVLKSIFSTKLLQKKTLLYQDIQHLASQLLKFQARKKYPSSVLSYYGYKILKNDQFFCTAKTFSAEIIIQYLTPLRSFDGSGQDLNGLEKALQQLRKDYGLFPITDQCLGVSSEGQIKVWVNQDYFQNRVNERAVLPLSAQQQISQLYSKLIPKSQQSLRSRAPTVSLPFQRQPSATFSPVKAGPAQVRNRQLRSRESAEVPELIKLRLNKSPRERERFQRLSLIPLTISKQIRKLN